ncbi:MAG TPA: hypothetical protein VG937_38695 [Polyangiaceae bacterium]|nr:hypothetical protein [Polyangiaceae bacterium]
MTQTLSRTASAAAVFCALAAIPLSAAASERRFVFNTESSVLAPGDAELEPWTTVRAGREHHYAAFDQRLEFELGLLPNLQTSLYWNFGAVSQSVLDETTGRRVRTSSSHFQSLSSEWKYKFSDALADSIGFAAYVEGSYGPDEAELEGKLIFDKQLHNLLLVANLVGEQEWEISDGETEAEQKLALTLGAGLFVTPSWVVSLEAIGTTTLVEGGDVESSVIYAGASLAYSSDRYWFALGAAPQVFAPKSASGDALELEHGEHLWARALLGFRL